MYTPAPWKAVSNYVVTDNLQVICSTADNVRCLNFAAEVASLEDVANCNLIAAAPDLLEACKTALVVLGQHYSGNCCNARIAQIQAAIAKAQGQVPA
jgi:hypothetical protein